MRETWFSGVGTKLLNDVFRRILGVQKSRNFLMPGLGKIARYN